MGGRIVSSSHFPIMTCRRFCLEQNNRRIHPPPSAHPSPRAIPLGSFSGVQILQKFLDNHKDNVENVKREQEDPCSRSHYPFVQGEGGDEQQPGAEEDYHVEGDAVAVDGHGFLKDEAS